MSVFRQRLAVSAVFVTALTVTVTAGCASSSKPGATADPTLSSSASAAASSTRSPGRAAQPGDLLISDGTSTVTIGGAKVVFPSTVTDATWSPDRSRIAFIDADGNVDSAHPDGTGRLVLTKKAPGTTRSEPSWDGALILYTQAAAGGASVVDAVYGNGWVNPVYQPIGLAGADVPAAGNSAASASTAHLPIGPLGEVAFQHKGASGPEVWVIDENQRGAAASKLVNGSHPAISPDGTEVAYVGTDGQIHLAPTQVPYGKPVQTTVISSGLSAPTHLVWTQDGADIAFSTATGVDEIPASADAAHSAVTVLSKSPGVASYAGAGQDRAERLAGADPIAGAIAVTQARYATVQAYQPSQSNIVAYSVALANPDDPAAAVLGAGGLPLLYTGGSALDPRTKAEMRRILGVAQSGSEPPTITIVGDTGMISAATENAVKALGYKTTRVSGADEYAVNAAHIKTVMIHNPASTVTQVLVVSGGDPAAAAAEALSTQLPVLLTKGQTLPTDAAQYLDGLGSGATVYAVGEDAKAALAAWTKPNGVRVQSIAGADAAETSVLTAKAIDGDSAGVILANPAVAGDVDVAAAAAQQLGYVVLLVDPAKGLEPATRQFLDDSSAATDTVLAVGPSGSIPDALLTQAASAAGDATTVTTGVAYDK